MPRKKKELGGQISLLTPQSQSYTPEQEAFINYTGKQSVILRATAGSGKTFSCVQRMKFLLDRGVEPSKILFLSFTKAAAEELQRRIGRSDVEIRTIHSLTASMLTKMGKGKKVTTFYEFIPWFIEKNKPHRAASEETKAQFQELVSSLYEEADMLSSAISAFKLQAADGIKNKIPAFYNQYREFLKDVRGRDFSDMLIETRDLLKDNKWLRIFKNKYDYIFVDEYQDTSAIQMEILLDLNAKYYYLIGDVNQAIYYYLGVNCQKIEDMLKERRETINMALSVNFRSDKNIVENSNLYSSLQASANSQAQGNVNKKILLSLDQLIPILEQKGEVAVLVRNNATIKKMETELLKRKIGIRYSNIFTDTDIKNIKKGEINENIRRKHQNFKPFFGENLSDLVAFIESHKTSNTFFTTIHKSKGREFDTCVVVNSLSRALLEENGYLKLLNDAQLQRISFTDSIEDVEAKNIHYVAISRSKHELYFMIYDC